MSASAPAIKSRLSVSASLDSTRRHKRCLMGGHQQGSIMVMVVSMLAITVLMFAFVVNYNHWRYKKTIIEDVAAVVAEAGIRNQLTYRVAGSPPTRSMIDDMVSEQQLLDRLHTLSIEYEFGLTEGGVYVPGGTQDPNPATQPFNTMRVKVCTPLDDVTGSFTMPVQDSCVWAEARYDLDECYCDYLACPAGNYSGPLGGLNRGICLLSCTVTSTLNAALNLLFTLDLSDLNSALECILKSLKVAVTTTVNWTLGLNAVKLLYTS